MLGIVYCLTNSVLYLSLGLERKSGVSPMFANSFHMVADALTIHRDDDSQA